MGMRLHRDEFYENGSSDSEIEEGDDNMVEIDYALNYDYSGY